MKRRTLSFFASYQRSRGKDGLVKTKRVVILSNGLDEEKSESDNGVADMAKSLALLTKEFNDWFRNKLSVNPNSRRSSQNEEYQKIRDGTLDRRDEEKSLVTCFKGNERGHYASSCKSKMKYVEYS
ncbi:hypothetical protein L1987_05265 [Smallanthus sonchifolius]|uniref:Uncharacterized protein n=1 Tax=Smallanthus sonchifolius TaxID=185202 RepID=A0ACB9JUZ5_9ASTR|nr:hypothetical protein L1987_05265 [Smallanthus sonchifolius]